MLTTFDLIYFSPTFTTRQILREIASLRPDKLRQEVDLTPCGSSFSRSYSSTEALLVGFPVYAGRVPETFVERLHGLQADGTPAVIVAVYGNRAYDDALLEMKTLLEARGFRTAAAAAFVARHNIVPRIAAHRPDAEDLAAARRFARELFDKMENAPSPAPDSPGLPVKGNTPFRPYHRMTVHPAAGRACTSCGLCARECPVGAIPAQDPRQTDAQRCITCMRCVHVCPSHARKLPLLARLLTRKKLSKLCKGRKQPEWVL